MIRPAVASDKTRAITLLEHSRTGAEFDLKDGITGFSFAFDPAYAERLFLTHLEWPRALCLVHEVEGTAQGLLMAVAAEHPYCEVWLARETLWWIEPLYRGLAAVKMLDAYEEWARGQGCEFVGMAGMGSDPEVAKLYRRRGYNVAEVHFLKAL
jgi:GNAT superfamily N-acetyltransferase